MSDDLSAPEHLEKAREIIWEAVDMLEEAQRVLFKAGDRYVGQVWGDGVRSILDITEEMSELAGDITAVHIEIGKLSKRDQARG
jgi:hypothetical protein